AADHRAGVVLRPSRAAVPSPPTRQSSPVPLPAATTDLPGRLSPARPGCPGRTFTGSLAAFADGLSPFGSRAVFGRRRGGNGDEESDRHDYGDNPGASDTGDWKA